MRKPENMYPSFVPKDVFTKQPQHLSGKSSTRYWTFQKALLELFTNLVDQARVTAKEEFPVNTPPLEHRITRRKSGYITDTYFAGDVILAEITYRKKEVKWTESFVKSSTKYEPSHVEGPYLTWVLTFKNLGARIKAKCFLRGVSGAEKEGNPDVIGKFGDGLPSAIDYLSRRKVNVTAATAGCTTTGILDPDGHSYIQHKGNGQTERSVVFKLTFMPDQPRLSCDYMSQYTYHFRDPFCPETFDPTSIYLSGSADRVSVDEDGPGSAPNAILLGEDMCGKFFARDQPVCDLDGNLFGYSLADPQNELIQGRDRGAMNPKLTRLAVDKLLCAGIAKSPRLRRKLVMELTGGCQKYKHDDIRPQNWTAPAVKLLQQESRIMFEGTILVYDPTPLCKMVAGFRDLEPKRCHYALDEGQALMNHFVEELRTLPREEIDAQGGAASGWASTVREDLLQLTGAKSVASAEFPGKLGAKHAVWVEEDVVLISRRSLKVDLKKEGFMTAKFLLEIISWSIERQPGSARQPDLPFEVYHLITTAEHRPEESPSTLAVNGASGGLSPGDGGAQGPPAGEAENVGPQLALSRAFSAPAASTAIAGEQANPDATAAESGPEGEAANAGAEVAPNGALPAPAAAAAAAEEQAHSAATAEESGDESDGIDGEGMAEDEPQDSEERPLSGGKRTCDTGEAEAAAKRNKPEASGSEGGGSGSGSGVAPPVTALVEPVVSKVAGMPPVSVKVDESTPSGGGAFASVKVEEPRSSEGAAATVVAPLQPDRSDEAMLVAGLGVSQEADGGEVSPAAQPPPPPTPISAPERNGEELGAFLSEGDFLPALIHVERHAMGAEGGSVDLYRIAGRKDNVAELSARFSAVVASERARSVLESAVKKTAVDMSLFCWNEPDALAAFVGQDADRIFVNLHNGSKSVDEWGVHDLPTQIASAMASVRSGTPDNVCSHTWSVEFRKWVMSEEL